MLCSHDLGRYKEIASDYLGIQCTCERGQVAERQDSGGARGCYKGLYIYTESPTVARIRN